LGQRGYMKNELECQRIRSTPGYAENSYHISVK